jgi:hypothetical protein
MMHDYKGNIITPYKNLKFIHVPCTLVILHFVNSTETNQIWSRIIVETPIVLKLVKKFPAFYTAQRFVTMSTGVLFCLQLLVTFISLFIFIYIHVCIFKCSQEVKKTKFIRSSFSP